MTEAVPDSSMVMVLPGVGLPLQRHARATPRPAPGEALIRVDACGVCGSDVFLQDGGFGHDKLPVVPGHEAAGRIVAVGDGADGHRIGQQVALHYLHGPADSPFARAGRENIGPGLTRMGVDLDGAFAEHVVRPLTTLVPVDPPLDPVVVAVSTDALATPWHALATVAGLRAGEHVVVVGPGGIGSNAVQIARHLGAATVVAAGRSRAKLDLAVELGATAAVPVTAGPTAIREAAGGQVDVVVQCAGESPEADRLAVDVAGHGARVVLVGASRAPFPLSSTDLIWRELTVAGSRGFTRRDIATVLDLVRAGALATGHLTGDVRPLAEAGAALDDLRAGRVLRTVLVPAEGGTP